ncbi:MAG: hypothetical protein ABL878_15285 [Burkholderiales bacterium]
MQHWIYSKLRVKYLALLWWVGASIAIAGAAPEFRESAITATARPVYSVSATPTVERLEFQFSAEQSTAWLNRKGDFGTDGWVSHIGLRCAEYQLGLRFGIGAPGCLNVEWISAPRFVSSQRQCNGARVMHSGGDSVADLGVALERVSCAERIIRCEGTCK